MGQIVYLESVDSTNRFAREMAKVGAADGTLVVANEQTGGRGRRGRGWISPAGEGIFMSLILRPDIALEDTAKLSLVTALAVANAIERATGLDARIKWPNDIVCGGRKVRGMLLEMDVADGKLESVVAGIGINVHQMQFPEEIQNTAASLDLLLGRRISRKEVIYAVLAAFDEAMALSKDDARFMQAYRERSATLGQRVQVIATNETFVGTAVDLTQSGTLIVEDEEGQRRKVLAADVSVRGLMGYV